MLTVFCYVITFIVYIIIMLWGLLGKHNGEYFGYGLFSFYFILPIVSFLGALVLGNAKTCWKWFYPVLFGTLGFAIPVVVFKQIARIPCGIYFVPSLIGLVIGVILSKFK